MKRRFYQVLLHYVFVPETKLLTQVLLKVQLIPKTELHRLARRGSLHDCQRSIIPDDAVAKFLTDLSLKYGVNLCVLVTTVAR